MSAWEDRYHLPACAEFDWSGWDPPRCWTLTLRQEPAYDASAGDDGRWRVGKSYGWSPRGLEGALVAAERLIKMLGFKVRKRTP